MPASSSPTGRGVNLGEGLRKARKDTPGSPTVREVALALNLSPGALSRYENGRRLASPEVVTRLLDYYVGRGLTISERTRETLMGLARGTESSPWVALSLPEQQRQLSTMLRFEQTATRIIDVAQFLIPGLLQTEEYARAIMVRAEVPDHQIDTRVAVRIGRQHAISRPDKPAKILAVIHQAALEERIGGPEVMARQLRHLLTIGKKPNVELRVVPKGLDWHPGLETAFVLDEFDDRTPVVHIEIRDTGLFFDQPEDVAPYQAAVQKVLREAMSKADTLTLIAREAEQIEETIR
ncbi:helix-turn-helix transcriptional regulator [Actinophytocola sp.]|uniref:helix-turn-helix domain-containing protein n=1 Tax=Actinophytocola sp. TaxID=1872138 RepID=UPI002D33CF9E|nr:helix-turn-helix transcriptional regulator [Actinophytocola sp.]HYQ69057.1 helix-turn-helix transcriptional regulator [Actinophytocola sp.]